VHFHILPRKSENDRFGDRNDEVYPALERSEADLPGHLTLRVDADEDRIARTPEEMEKEATWLRGFFTPESMTSLPQS
jgi:bis(5'-adenosyl)-triphosphatase